MDFAKEPAGQIRGIDNRLSAPDTQPNTCDICGGPAELKTGTLFETYYCKKCAENEGIKQCDRCKKYDIIYQHNVEHICTDCMSAEEYEIVFKK